MRGSGARLVTTAIVADSRFPFPQSLQKSGNSNREVHRLSRFRNHQTACSCLDSRFPELSSGRSLRLKASQWYVGRLHRATYRDARVTDQFYRVLSFIDPPSSLFYPRVAFSALFARPGRGRFQPRVLRA